MAALAMSGQEARGTCSPVADGRAPAAESPLGPVRWQATPSYPLYLRVRQARPAILESKKCPTLQPPSVELRCYKSKVL